MSKEKTLHDLICEKLEEIQTLINNSEDKDEYAVFACCTDGKQTGQLLVGTGANVNLGICNSMASSEGTYFAIASSAILFEGFRNQLNPEEVIEALSKMSPPSAGELDLATLTPKTQA